jgi:hypothetical protein
MVPEFLNGPAFNSSNSSLADAEEQRNLFLGQQAARCA